MLNVCRSKSESREGCLLLAPLRLQATVHADGTIDFVLRELSERDLVAHKWPNAPLDAIHECYIHNSDDPSK